MASLWTIDLSSDTAMARDFRRKAARVGLVLLGTAATAIAVRASGLAGHEGIVAWGLVGLAFALVVYGSIALYMSDVTDGNRAALQGMAAGGIPCAACMGWGLAWTTGAFDAWLGLLGMTAGLLLGGVIGAIGGVIFGFVERRVLSGIQAHPKPVAPGGGELADRWVDGL